MEVSKTNSDLHDEKFDLIFREVPCLLEMVCKKTTALDERHDEINALLVLEDIV